MQRPTPTSLMLRRMTASAVLDALRAGGPMTGSDLISATGLARPTVHVVCNDLIRLGWIRETESHPTARTGGGGTSPSACARVDRLGAPNRTRARGVEPAREARPAPTRQRPRDRRRAS